VVAVEHVLRRYQGLGERLQVFARYGHSRSAANAPGGTSAGMITLCSIAWVFQLNGLSQPCSGGGPEAGG
jgi:hypothetical protein